MKKQQLSAEQKRLETDLWIIALVTLGVFLFYAATGKQLMSFVANSNISVIPRLLLNAGVQFGVAGLGITIVCILRKESFTHFGLIRKNIFKAIIGTIICAPSIQYIEQMDEKPEDYSQEDDAGLDLIDFYVLPHYLTAPFKKVTEKIMTDFSDLNLCPINNRQGIVIDGEGSKVICKD